MTLLQQLQQQHREAERSLEDAEWEIADLQRLCDQLEVELIELEAQIDAEENRIATGRPRDSIDPKQLDWTKQVT